MTIGAYMNTPDFAYPGWRLTVPGGPAGGHYKGFTHNYGAGTDLEPGDDYEQDREDGMSSHDAAHATRRNPRGVYRSSGEVPPRPNASGSAHTYRGYQTKRHAGTSLSPGSFPANFIETPEDSLVDGNGWSEAWQPAHTPEKSAGVEGLGIAAYMPVEYGMPADAVAYQNWLYGKVPAPGATNTIARRIVDLPQPAPIVYTAATPALPPMTPAPAPSVASNVVVPARDGSGNFVSVATGAIVPAAQVTQNPITQQYNSTAAAAPTSLASVENWLTQPSSFFPSIPNWGLVAAAAAGAMLLMGGSGRHR
jgi:hypothetical protein